MSKIMIAALMLNKISNVPDGTADITAISLHSLVYVSYGSARDALFSKIQSFRIGKEMGDGP